MRSFCTTDSHQINSTNVRSERKLCSTVDNGPILLTNGGQCHMLFSESRNFKMYKIDVTFVSHASPEIPHVLNNFNTLMLVTIQHRYRFLSGIGLLKSAAFQISNTYTTKQKVPNSESLARLCWIFPVQKSNTFSVSRVSPVFLPVSPIAGPGYCLVTHL